MQKKLHFGCSLVEIHSIEQCKIPALEILLCSVCLLNSSTSFFIQALDADMNSNVTYRIRTTEARKLFELDPVTGELKVRYPLDFEKLSPEETTHTFVVEAVDGAGSMPPGLATVTVTVMVSRHF